MQPSAYNYSYYFICGDGKYMNWTILNNNLNVTGFNLIAPTLTNGQVNPGTGFNGTTLFTFSVNYMDDDNNAPTYLNVTINDTQSCMTKQNILDTNFMDGCIYVFSTTLDDIGIYSFFFTCSDGLYNASTITYLGPIVKK